MFTAEYKKVYFLSFLLFTVWSGVKAASKSLNVTTATSIVMKSTVQVTNGQIQPTSTVILSSVTKSITSPHTTKEVTMNGEKDKLEPWVIIVISASAAVFLIVVMISVLICIFRRRRIRQIERARNLSYNNMNYESTVKFKSDMDTDGTTLGSNESANSPQKTNNDPRRDAGYERVDLPVDDSPPKRPYENVNPQNMKETNDTERPKQRYENVTPMVSSANDKAKAPYEEVFLDSANDQKKRNDKYYENVELKN